jgi:hypothetical protein
MGKSNKMMVYFSGITFYQKIVRSVPTTVMVTPKGKVVVVFERASVKYDLTIDGIANALERNSDIQTIPLSPFLGGQTETALAIYWELADPPGLAHYVEVQFRRCRPPPEPGMYMQLYPYGCYCGDSHVLL